jgi:Na+-transporting NADH:ubiquinone oxidoreductase subunit C
MREDTRTLLFAGAVCITCSLLLSGMAAGLKGFQKANEEFDVKRNIVKAFGVDIAGATAESVADIFRKHIEERVIDAETGSVVEGMDPSRIPSDAADRKELLPLYIWMEDGTATKYAFPISGKGLWSMLYGYLALDADLETIAGISFYRHGETPGLGAEIEKDWFQSQFSGKQLYNDDGEPTDFKVVKPGSARGDTVVDGISGATLTGKGVESLLRNDAKLYADYFKKIEGN